MGSMVDDSLDGGRHMPFLPEEIVSRIISAVVGDGLRVSTGAAQDDEVDRVTIRSLLATSVAARRETLRQVFRRPLRFRLGGEQGTCDCPPQLDIIGHKECRCTLLLQKIVRLPLARWTRVVVHFDPFPVQVDDGGGGDHNTGQTRQAEAEDEGDGTGGGGRGVAVRSEFRAAVQRVTHYSRSLATTLYYLLKQRANLSCEAACCGVIEMSRRRHYGPVYCSYDPKFPALPYDVDFVFETPPGPALTSTSRHCITPPGSGEEEDDDDDETHMPLWTMNMVDALLMPWWRFVSKRPPTARQITLPATIAAAFTMGRDRIATEFPHRPADVAERLQRDFGAFWAVRPGSISSSDDATAASLWPCVVKFDGSLEWYLSPAPLLKRKEKAVATTATTTKWTIRGVPVLRIEVPDRDSDDSSEGRWKGEFLASDG
ncbi:hypothetical protein AYL99_08290 [Fonsecaea erecta]|uniref:Uncharacterized protein n=1 Tax=Fonsecaea erecta TaxID=1367422 RepID=A0A178ZD24_9EURO|nr:hypothetical protein AYL99_08290 [Fonsecaea erecta]OAP57552.1 hypothetical protein AYL99_08290 [Fonsecaea erecta]